MRKKLIACLTMLLIYICTYAEKGCLMNSYLTGELRIRFEMKWIGIDDTTDFPFPKVPSKEIEPEVVIDGRMLYFITPCDGCVLRLVQEKTGHYETVIKGNTMELPTIFQGTYELQIMRGDVIFYAEVEL